MQTILVLPATLVLGAALSAQTIVPFPSEYTAVPEGPYNSYNLPLAYGTSRVMCIYDRVDVAVPVGTSIRRLGFRQDGDITTQHNGRGLQLEVRMGYTQNGYANADSTFDSNYAGSPVTVFGPALFTLPNLRDPASPLTDGRFFITLTTPFPYNPGTNNLVVEYRVLGTSGGGSSFNYALDRADFFAPVVNGPAGCPHLAGGPAVLTVQPVAVNSYYSSSLAQAPANSLCVLALNAGSQLAAPFSLQPVVAGIGPACMGQVSLAGTQALTTFTDSSGNAFWSFLVRNNPAFNDVFVSSQCAIFDFFAPGGVVVSNGVQVQIGIAPRTAIIYGQGPPGTLTTGSVYPRYCPVAFFEYQ